MSGWKKGDKVRDAAGPNSLFRQAAWHFYFKRDAGPWLWLEPDCVPLLAGWDDVLESAYRASGKPFLGALMTFPGMGDHLNGVAIYPRDAVTSSSTLVKQAMWRDLPELEMAFDVAGGADVLRQASVTDLIAFEPREGAVLFHGDHDGALLSKLLNVQNAPPSDSTIRKLKSKGGEQNGNRSTKSSSAAATKPAAGQSKPKSNGTVNGNGAAHVPTVEPMPTVGDQIRAAVATLESLATNSNRRTRILKLLRKTTLLPRIAR